MLKSIKIDNFQSIKQAEIDFGEITIVVGDSHSGKSAFIKAIKALYCNIRGNRDISAWASKLKVEGKSEAGSAILERSHSSCNYTLKTELGEETYTKTGGTVPIQISRVLGANPEEVEVLLAKQRADPYLVNDAGSSVASSLGSLTSVDLIFSAVREANRRRSSAQSKLKHHQEQLSSTSQRLTTLGDIEGQSIRLEDTESSLWKLLEIHNEICSLKTILKIIVESKKKLDSTKLDRSIPSLEDIQTTQSLLVHLTESLKSIKLSYDLLLRYKKEAASAQEALEQAETDLHDTMDELGVCPLCERRL